MLKLFLFSLCCVATSCTTSRAPIAEYSSSTVTSSLPTAVSVDVAFALSNTNDEPLQLEQYNYAVSIAGDIVYRGFAEAEQTLPRGSTVNATIPIVIPRAYLVGQDTVVWRLRGSLEYISHNAFVETLVDSKMYQPSISIAASDYMVVPPTE
ncbi:MAG: hypothetical protein QGI78_07415 [Phycisphaerales bacterium]|jgi:hypothetical protein|nr:hypothetical protein [Phycisphaerales bacterium]